MTKVKYSSDNIIQKLGIHFQNNILENIFDRNNENRNEIHYYFVFFAVTGHIVIKSLVIYLRKRKLKTNKQNTL